MKRGSALIIVLWVVALLSVLIGGFAFDMHVEAKIVSHLRKRLKAEYLSKAGLEYAQALFIHSQEVKGKGDSDEMKGKYWYDSAKRLRQGYAIMGLTVKLGEGTFILDILPEPALRNLNAIKDDEDWDAIFTVGGVPDDINLRKELIDCLYDWRDPDDDRSTDGAETDDYYARLDPPYKARGHKATVSSKTSKVMTPDKMVNLDTIEELLLIKGWSHAILYGGYAEDGDTNSAPMTGIADLLTVSPEAGETVNINAASKRVLMTLPGIDSTLADAIIAEREKGGRQGLTGGAQISEDYFYTDVNNLFSRVPELNRLTAEEQQRLKALGGTASSVLRVRSSGVVHGVEYRMTSTLGVTASGNGTAQIRK
ncbi:MAG: helix-hairpin-helix domain-containing protein [bacterium]